MQSSTTRYNLLRQFTTTTNNYTQLHKHNTQFNNMERHMYTTAQIFVTLTKTVFQQLYKTLRNSTSILQLYNNVQTFPKLDKYLTKSLHFSNYRKLHKPYTLENVDNIVHNSTQLHKQLLQQLYICL